MNNLVFGPIVALGLSLAAAGALAEDKKGDPFDRLDANGDGKVNAAEMSAHGEAMFAEADADGDGLVTREEMRAVHEARRAERRKQYSADKNDDGVVDRTEFINAAQARFDALDENGDGVLSEDEQPHRHRRHRHR